jgi:hypothetical protein
MLGKIVFLALVAIVTAYVAMFIDDRQEASRRNEAAAREARYKRTIVECVETRRTGKGSLEERQFCESFLADAF